MGTLTRVGIGAALALALLGCSKESKEKSKKPTEAPGQKTGAARAKMPVANAPTAPPCTSHKDCRVTCDIPNNCCGQLCDCTNAYHKDQIDPMRAANKKVCEQSPGCPKADCAMPTKDHVPACMKGKCVAAIYPRATRCKQDSDCQLYCFQRGDCLGQTCGPCRQAFHKDDIAGLDKWRADNCTRKGPWRERAKCSRAAMNSAPVCRQGICETKAIPW